MFIGSTQILNSLHKNAARSSLKKTRSLPLSAERATIGEQNVTNHCKTHVHLSWCHFYQSMRESNGCVVSQSVITQFLKLYNLLWGNYFPLVHKVINAHARQNIAYTRARFEQLRAQRKMFFFHIVKLFSYLKKNVRFTFT